MTDITPEIFIKILERSLQEKDPRGYLQSLLEDKNYSFSPDQANQIEALVADTKGLSNDREALIIDNVIDDLKLRALASQVEFNTGEISQNDKEIAEVKGQLIEAAEAILVVSEQVGQVAELSIENRAIIEAQQLVILGALQDLRPDITIGEINIDQSTHNTDIDIKNTRKTSHTKVQDNSVDINQQIQQINQIINNNNRPYELDFPRSKIGVQGGIQQGGK